jgi:hypothetical protein
MSASGTRGRSIRLSVGRSVGFRKRKVDDMLKVKTVDYCGPDRRLITWSDGHTEYVTRSQALDYLVDWNDIIRAEWEDCI